MKREIAKVRANESQNKQDQNMLQQLENQRQVVRNLRDDWFSWHKFYMQKINDLSKFETKE